MDRPAGQSVTSPEGCQLKFSPGEDFFSAGNERAPCRGGQGKTRLAHASGQPASSWPWPGRACRLSGQGLRERGKTAEMPCRFWPRAEAGRLAGVWPCRQAGLPDRAVRCVRVARRPRYPRQSPQLPPCWSSWRQARNAGGSRSGSRSMPQKAWRVAQTSTMALCLGALPGSKP